MLKRLWRALRTGIPITDPGQVRVLVSLAVVFAAWIIAAVLIFSDWLDSHSGAAQGIFSGALVMATLAYALYTRDLITKTQQQRRPYVYVEVVKRGAMLDAVLRNGGERGAENVKLTVIQDVVVPEYDKRGILGWPMFQNDIPFLPPGRAISQTVAHFPSIGLGRLEPQKRILQYRVQYEEGDLPYSEDYAYDLSFLLPVGGEQFPLADDYLGQLNDEVARLHQTVARAIQGVDGSLREIAAALNRSRP